MGYLFLVIGLWINRLTTNSRNFKSGIVIGYKQSNKLHMKTVCLLKRTRIMTLIVSVVILATYGYSYFKPIDLY